MSYAKFMDELSQTIAELFPDRKKRSWWQLPRRKVDIAADVLMKRWLAARRYSELVSWFNSNYDTGGGEKQITQISDALIRSHEIRLLNRLWKQAIVIRKDHNPKEALAAYDKYARALRSLNLYDEAVTVVKECEDFKTGKPHQYLTTSDKRKITEELFWELIDECKAEGDSPPERCEVLRARLPDFSRMDIRRFGKLADNFATEIYTWELWALAFLELGGCSDDAFQYFRQWIVLEGKSAYTLARDNVAQFAAEADFSQGAESEEFGYVAEEAYESKKGEPMPISSSRVLREPKGRRWDEEAVHDSHAHLVEALRQNPTSKFHKAGGKQ